MGLKVWNLVLVSGLLLVLLISFLAGFIPTLDFLLLISVILILFITYISLTRPDQMRVPTALEMEKMKRKMKTGDNGFLLKPGDKN
jgi:hypothetical protein